MPCPQLLAMTSAKVEVFTCYAAVWDQLATLARTTMFDPAHVKLSGAYWPLTTACFLVRIRLLRGCLCL